MFHRIIEILFFKWTTPLKWFYKWGNTLDNLPKIKKSVKCCKIWTMGDYSCSFYGLQNPADGDCSHEIKRRLFLRRKVMTNLDSILKSRDVTLPTKVRLVKAMVFPVVRYGCESWTVKKVECRKIDTFQLWCWRRLLRVPWTAKGFNQSILKEISPGCSLEGLMLKLKLQYFGHFMWRVNSLEKTLMLGGIGGRRRRGDRGWDGWMASPTRWT